MKILVIGLIVLGAVVSIPCAQARAMHARLSQTKRTSTAR